MEEIKLSFERFAEYEVKNKSPLYYFWCKNIVNTPALLKLSSFIPASQPKPNLFFAAIYYLTKKHSQHPLASYLNQPETINLADSFQALKLFCQDYQLELKTLFKTKRVQTNEVQRASYLYPIFAEIAAKSLKPLTIIEIGTSAGLLLNLEHFHYHIEQQPPIQFGQFNSPLKIYAKNLGNPLSTLPPLSIASRIGIDLSIVDTQDEEQALWLECLIWPELTQRKENLKTAIQLNRHVKSQLIEGDFRPLLPLLLKKAQQENTQIIIFHTHVANQFPPALKEELLHLLQTNSMEQPLYHVYNNLFDTHLHVDSIYQGEIVSEKILREIDGHGEYYVWR